MNTHQQLTEALNEVLSDKKEALKQKYATIDQIYPDPHSFEQDRELDAMRQVAYKKEFGGVQIIFADFESMIAHIPTIANLDGGLVKRCYTFWTSLVNPYSDRDKRHYINVRHEELPYWFYSPEGSKLEVPIKSRASHVILVGQLDPFLFQILKMRLEKDTYFWNILPPQADSFNVDYLSNEFTSDMIKRSPTTNFATEKLQTYAWLQAKAQKYYKKGDKVTILRKAPDNRIPEGIVASEGWTVSSVRQGKIYLRLNAREDQYKYIVPDDSYICPANVVPVDLALQQDRPCVFLVSDSYVPPLRRNSSKDFTWVVKSSTITTNALHTQVLPDQLSLFGPT